MSRGLYTNYLSGLYQQKYTTTKIKLPYLEYIYLVLIDNNNPCKHNVHIKLWYDMIVWDNI